MRELNEALVLAMRTFLPSNPATLQTYEAQPAIFATVPVPDEVATFQGRGASVASMFLTIGPTLSDDNPQDKDAELREITSQITVWATKDNNTAADVELKAQEIIDELHRQASRVAPISGWGIVLLELQGIVDNEDDYWIGRVVGVRVLLDKL